MNSQCLSVGIDVGTTTFHYVVNELRLEKRVGKTNVPRYALAGYTTVHESPIFLTPYASGEDAIDENKVLARVHNDFETHGIDRQAIETGGVIVTGRAAKKTNAARVVSALSQMSGLMVSTIAGCRLEAVAGIRATVLGAAVHTLQLSGDTIFVSDHTVLPLRDVPVVKIDANSTDIGDELAHGTALVPDAKHVAYCFDVSGSLTFERVAHLAEELLDHVRDGRRDTLIAVFNRDFAKIFGYHVHNRLTQTADGHLRIVSVDGIEVDDNTYLDFGRLLPEGVLPVTAKTLYFRGQDR